MAEKMKNIGITEQVYDKLAGIQEKHRTRHNANKTFSQVIEDLLNFRRQKATPIEN